MFQRAMLAYMYKTEQGEDGAQLVFSRTAIDFGLQLKWQTHYTNACKQLRQAGWITIIHRYGQEEYQLTHDARQQLWKNENMAKRYVRPSEFGR